RAGGIVADRSQTALLEWVGLDEEHATRWDAFGQVLLPELVRAAALPLAMAFASIAWPGAGQDREGPRVPGAPPPAGWLRLRGKGKASPASSNEPTTSLPGSPRGGGGNGGRRSRKTPTQGSPTRVREGGDNVVFLRQDPSPKPANAGGREGLGAAV